MKWSSFQTAIFDDYRDGTGNVCVSAVPGSGKCLGAGTPVLMFDGSIKRVEEVVVGDVLMGPDSLPRNVLSLSSGRTQLFQVIPVKGDRWVCTWNHILTLTKTHRNLGALRDVSLDEFLTEQEGKDRIDRGWKLIRTEIDFQPAHVEIDPYLVGLWLGDGTRGEAQLTNASPEIMEYCRKIAPRYGHELIVRREEEKNSFNLRFRLGERGSPESMGRSTLRRFFKSCTIGTFKFIPQEYLVNDSTVRLSLLAGLLDTDGHLDNRNCFRWSSVSPIMAEQMLFLCRSLGLAAYKAPKIVNGTTYYVVSISGHTDQIPNLVPRKKAGPRLQIKRVLCTGFRVELIGHGPYYGFEVDGDHRFVLGDFTVTHNSTSAVEMLKHAPKGLKGNTLLTSFSKDSVEELKARELPWDVEARTMNSLGLRAVMKARNSMPKLNTERVYRILDEVLGKPPEDQAKRAGFGSFRARVKALTDFAKNSLVYDVTKLIELAEHHEIETTPPDWMRDALADKYRCPWEDSLAVVTQRTLDACKKDDGIIDFNDQLWLPVVLGYPVEQFSRIVVDELQDTSPCQVELLRRALSTNGRLFGFGETGQAVYAFRGAGIGLDPIIKAFNMRSMPLSISYRCPIAVVKEAQQINPDMQWAPDAIEGSVSTLVADLLPSKLVIGDTVLSRTNAPLIRLFMKCLFNGIPVGMAGKDVGARLFKFVEGSESRDANQLIEYTDQWAKEEIERRKKRNPNAKTDAIDDHVECIRALAEDTNQLSVVTDRIKRMLLVPPESRVTLSTTHRAKGKQWPRVFILESTYPVRAAYWRQYASKKKGDPEKWAQEVALKIQNESIEERNIMYVAITRAKRELIYVR
jgi:hypothetical protein